MVVRVEDLLEEAQKEGDGDVAEAEVHMGVEDRVGRKRRITSPCLSPSQGLKTFSGSNCQIENKKLGFVFLRYT